MGRPGRETLEFLFIGPLYSIYKVLNEIRRDVRKMATQADVNALAERVGTIGTQLTKGLGEVKDEIARLKDSNESVDLSALEAKVDALGGTAQQLDDVVPDTATQPGTGVGNPTPGPGEEVVEVLPGSPQIVPTEESTEEGTAFTPDGTPVDETPSEG